MNQYILLVDILENGEEHTHAVYFSSDDGVAASDYADMWMNIQYTDPDDVDTQVLNYDIVHIKTIGTA